MLKYLPTGHAAATGQAAGVILDYNGKTKVLSGGKKKPQTTEWSLLPLLKAFWH